jgi:hypothetical protein
VLGREIRSQQGRFCWSAGPTRPAWCWSEQADITKMSDWPQGSANEMERGKPRPILRQVSERVHKQGSTRMNSSSTASSSQSCLSCAKVNPLFDRSREVMPCLIHTICTGNIQVLAYFFARFSDSQDFIMFGETNYSRLTIG